MFDITVIIEAVFALLAAIITAIVIPVSYTHLRAHET